MTRFKYKLLVTCIFIPSLAAANGNVTSPSYDPLRADQFQGPLTADTMPADPAMREEWAQHLAYDATVYGTVSGLLYRQMYDQAIDRTTPSFVGFNRFRHDRTLAGPGYAPFRTPNADTLYSNAYLDLRNGPVLLQVPDTAGRYFTVNFLDMFGNATNISARTHGTKGGRFLIAPPNWRGEVPPEATLFRVPGNYIWILLRVLVSNSDEVPAANALQDRFAISELSPMQSPTTSYPAGSDKSAIGFFRILDFVLRNNGHPEREDALVYRFEGIGVSGPQSFDQTIVDPPIRRGLEAGYAAAGKLIEASVGQGGRKVGSWGHSDNVGRYGYNYLFRSSVNTLGTGGNVDDENYAFTTFVDGSGQRLDGSKAGYQLVLLPPPPVNFFWSVTVYDARSRELFPNPLRRYLVNDRTPGLLRGRNGSVTVRFSPTEPAKGAKANWLPIPRGPFYVVIRAQGPGQDIIDRRWHPNPINRFEP